VLAVAALVQPSVILLVSICIWKLATESLFVVARAPIWEVIERFGSYAAPIALACLLLGHEGIAARTNIASSGSSRLSR
jgi:hypothetical protein